MKNSFLLLLLCLQGFFAYGQTEPAEVQGQHWQERFFQAPEMVLPLLQEAAIRFSARVEHSDAAKEMAMEDIRITRKEIFSGVSLNSSYQYGTMMNLFPGGINPDYSFNAFKLPALPRYTIGLSVNFPVGQLLSRHNEIKKKKLALKQAGSDRKMSEREVRQQVVRLYQDIKLAKAALELNQESYQTANIHYKMAEKQLLEGEIQIFEMAKVQEIFAKAAIARETAKIEYETTILIMEETIGMSINDLMKSSK